MSDSVVYRLPGGLPRALGRDTDLTVRLWDKLIGNIPVAPRVFEGVIPKKSPNVRRFYHASFLSQRGRGYCTGFNTCGTLMTRLRIPEGATIDSGNPLPLIQLSPLYTYDITRWQCVESGYHLGPGDGLIASQTYIASQKRGCVELRYYPSDPTDIDKHRNGTKPPREVIDRALHSLVSDFAIADSFEHGLELNSGGFPLTMASMIPFGMMETDTSGFFRMNGSSLAGGHCYTLLDYDKGVNLAWIAQAWEKWGERTSDPHYESMHGFTQVGTCPLDELEKWFSDSDIATGKAEIMVPNTIEGFAPVIVDYSSM